MRFVDIQPGGDPVTHMPEMDYDALEKAITEKTKAVVTVDLGGIVCDYDRIFEIVWRKRGLFRPMESDGTPLGDLSAKIQRGLGCVAVVADCAHSLGASRTVTRSGKGTGAGPQKRWCGDIAHFTSFSFHAVKNFTTAEGGASAWCLPTSVYDTGSPTPRSTSSTSSSPSTARTRTPWPRRRWAPGSTTSSAPGTSAT